MEIHIISNVHIRPAHPTPLHLRHLKLSALDQLLPFPYASIVFFYSHGDRVVDLTRKLELLKRSLSEILPKFYPLAGRIKDHLAIDCNDEGVRYLEAQVNCNLNDFLHQLDIMSINKFLPVDLSVLDDPHVANVQINVFECESIAIGLCISHKVLDGAGLGLFSKMWAAAARGEPCSLISLRPNFNSTSVFSTDTYWLGEATYPMWGAVFRPGKFITKRFVFSPDSVSRLREEACESSNQHPTRVVAVSALLWRSFITASRQRQIRTSSPPRSSVLTHLVNLRRRVDNELSMITDQTLCNLLWIAPATAASDIDTEHLGPLCAEVKNAISKIDSQFVNKLRGTEADASQFVSESLRIITDTGLGSGSDLITFSSWCGFGFYDVDFGWGGPVWVGYTPVEAPVFFNVVVLIETKDGEGIEAWVAMDEEDLEFMASDSGLLEYASIDSSPVRVEYASIDSSPVRA